MAKLYVFGIGGTGSRVLKALTMLLASGVKLGKNISDVIPVIIDPDIANGDMARTLDIMTLYQAIRRDIEDPENFFRLNLQTLPQLIDADNPASRGNFQFKINGTNNLKFQEFIGINQFSKENKGLTSLLFSKQNLESAMDVGFKGNPNIGSTVLNQLTGSEQYKEFAQTFTPGDRIFIISSIFGGTGAAGFPLLLKNLRFGNPSLPNSEDIKNSVIGAISVLPYFNVSLDDGMEIDSDTFYDKAKAALTYYNRTIIETNQINALYYIGDRPTKVYDNQVGDQGQKNPAHFIELASAYAIIDFCKSNNNFNTIGGKAQNFEFKEFGLDGSADPIIFPSLDHTMKADIYNPLVLFKFLNNYFTNGLETAINEKTTWTVQETRTDASFFANNTTLIDLKKFMKYFGEWIEEMSRNQDKFNPFNLSADKPYDYINQVNAKKNFLSSGSDYKDFEKLNIIFYRKVSQHNAFSQFIKMLERTTLQILQKRKLIEI